MEALIEILLEIFGEIFLEGFVYLIGWILSKIVYDEKKKRIVKYGISFAVFACSIALLIYAVITKKTRYVQIVLIYFLVLVLFYIANFTNQNILHRKKLEPALLWGKRIIHYSFPITLILFAHFYPSEASIAIISVSSVGLFIYLCINLCRIFYRYPSYRKNERKISKLIRIYIYQREQSIFQEAKMVMEMNLAAVKSYSRKCSKEEFLIMVDIVAEFSSVSATDLYEELLLSAEKHFDNPKEVLSKVYDRMIEKDI
ncbi:MAG: hypothetical protein K2K15_03845 [Anaeroplasmataceae bacterium]|nr:hypothetical protein [Anaeroplasmataceae bacterium]